MTSLVMKAVKTHHACATGPEMTVFTSMCWRLPELISCFHSGDETETDSEIEDRVDGVKSWLSKNKATAKTLSDEGSLKSARSVLVSSVQYDR